MKIPSITHLTECSAGGSLNCILSCTNKQVQRSSPVFNLKGLTEPYITPLFCLPLIQRRGSEVIPAFIQQTLAYIKMWKVSPEMVAVLQPVVPQTSLPPPVYSLWSQPCSCSHYSTDKSISQKHESAEKDGCAHSGGAFCCGKLHKRWHAWYMLQRLHTDSEHRKRVLCLQSTDARIKLYKNKSSLQPMKCLQNWSMLPDVTTDKAYYFSSWAQLSEQEIRKRTNRGLDDGSNHTD